jgi:hypothetical protein
MPIEVPSTRRIFIGPPQDSKHVVSIQVARPPTTS